MSNTVQTQSMEQKIQSSTEAESGGKAEATEASGKSQFPIVNVEETSLYNETEQKFDIVAVHGCGQSGTPWSSRDGGSWLKTMAVANSWETRIIQYSYDLDVLIDSCFERKAFIEEGLRLLGALVELRKTQDPPLPLVFFSHDIGGIIVKEALLLAGRHEHNYTNIQLSTHALVFFGYPHRLLKADLVANDRVSRLIFTSFPKGIGSWSARTLTNSFVAVNNSFLQSKMYVRATTINHHSIHEHLKEQIFDTTITTYGTVWELNIPSNLPHKDLIIERDAVEFYELMKASVSRISSFSHIRNDTSAFLESVKARASPTYPSKFETLIDHGWLVDNPAFRRWLDEQGPSILHIYGASSISRVAHYCMYECKAQSNDDGLVLYFRFDKSDIRFRSIGDLSNSFLFQILNTNRDFAPRFIEDIDRPGFRNCWTSRDSFFFLKSTWMHLDHRKKMYWIIDGIDQCDESSQWFLSEIQNFAKFSERKFKVLVTSNSYSHNLEVLSQVSSIDLQNYAEMESQAIKEDLGKPTWGRLSIKPLLFCVKSEIGCLLNSCKDDYLLRSLILEWLMDFRFETATKKALNQEIQALSPPSLEKVTQRILGAIPQRKWTWARKVIMWTLCSVRPLSPEELEMAIRFPVPPNTSFSESEASIDIMLELCECFGPLFVLENGEIRLAHPSARDMLLGHNISSQEKQQWYTLDDTEESNRQMADVCLSILSNKDVQTRIMAACRTTPNTEPIFENRLNLVSYAIQYWPRHYRLGYSKGSNIEKLETTSDYLRNPDLLRCWAAASWYFDDPYIRSDKSFLSILPIVASLGIRNLVTNFIEEQGEISSELMEMALREAARYGQRAIVLILLKHPSISLSACTEAIEDAAKSLEIKVLKDLVQHVTTEFGNRKWPTILTARLAFGGAYDLLKSLLQSKIDADFEEKSELSAPLHCAVVQNNERIVDLLLQQGADPNMHYPCGDNTSPIIAAAKYGYVAVIKKLLEAGASVEASDSKGRTALWFATLFGHYRALQTLIDAGANKKSVEDMIGSSEMPVFLSTVQAPFIKCLRLLLQHGVNPNSKFPGSGNLLPLSWAAKIGRADICRLLLEFDADLEGNLDDRPLYAAITSHEREVLDLFLERGVNINAEVNIGDSGVSTPLIEAVWNRNLDIAKLFLDNGANINVSTDSGNAPLPAAIASKSLDMVRLLIDAGADFTKTYSDIGWQPFHYAYDSAEILEFLIGKGADINASCPDGTALYISAFNNCPAAVDLLVSQGADLEIKCEAQGYADDNYNPLLIAAERGHLQIIKSLLEGGAYVNAENPHHRVPLSLAVYNGNDSCVPTILEYNPNLEIVDDYGDSVLHCIRPSTSLSTVRTLVNHGASVTTRNKNDETPLALAVGVTEPEASIDIIKYLIEKKVDVNAVDNVCGGALHAAATKGNINVIKLLLENGADVNLAAPNVEAGTPLQAAIMSLARENEKHEAIWYLIEEASTNVNAHGGWLGSALNVSLLAGTLSISKALLAKGADSDWADNFGRLPIHYASFHGLENVRPLVGPGVDIRAKNGQGQTLLHIAVAAGHSELVEFYVSRGVDCINEPDNDGWTPVLWACRISGQWSGSFSIDASIIKLLVSNGADLWVRGKDFDREWSPLKLARYHRASDEICKLLTPTSLTRINDKGNTENWDHEFHLCSTRANPFEAYCDVCLFSTYGIMYTCETCFEMCSGCFALCSKCYCRKKDFHPSHSEEGWKRENEEVIIEEIVPEEPKTPAEPVQRVQDDDSEGDWDDSDNDTTEDQET